MAQDFIYRRDIRPNLTGRVRELTGAENVKSALENRLSTSLRSIPFLPQYGVNLKDFLNMPMTADNRTRIIDEVQQQILRDRRVKEIRKIDARTTEEGLVLIQADVVLIGTNVNLSVEVTT